LGRIINPPAQSQCVKITYRTVMRLVAVLLCAVAAVILLLCWGIGMKFWSLVGILLVVMALAAAYFVAVRDYIAGATPTALAGVIASFLLLPPNGLELLAVILLFTSSGLAFALYEVD